MRDLKFTSPQAIEKLDALHKALQQGDGMNCPELAAELGYSYSVVYRYCDELEQRGLAHKTGQRGGRCGRGFVWRAGKPGQRRAHLGGTQVTRDPLTAALFGGSV